MRLVVLTTGAVRRRFFVENLQRQFPVARVFIETRDPKPPFPVDHTVDFERKIRERDHWYAGKPPKFAELAEVAEFHSLNEPVAVAAIRELRPEVVVVYGTGPLSEDVLSLCPDGIVNFHNGDPEEYRGLDCHLWPVYHGDFEAIRMTLHRIDPDLDTGDIVDRRSVPLARGMPLSDLRRAATEVTAEMALDALAAFERAGAFKSEPQRRKGRYYSWMPAVLKQVCVTKFERHTAKL